MHACARACVCARVCVLADLFVSFHNVPSLNTSSGRLKSAQYHRASGTKSGEIRWTDATKVRRGLRRKFVEIPRKLLLNLSSFARISCDALSENQPYQTIFDKAPKTFCWSRTDIFLNMWTPWRLIVRVLHVTIHNRQAWTNRVDPDQTAPKGAVWSGSTLFAIPLAHGLVQVLELHLRFDEENTICV